MPRSLKRQRRWACVHCVLQVPDSSWEPHSSYVQLEPLVSCVPHCHAQEVTRLCQLPPGSYVIVPSTYLPNTEGSFTVVIATKIDRYKYAAFCLHFQYFQCVYYRMFGNNKSCNISSLLIENTGFESLLLLCLQAVLTTSNMLEEWLKKEVFVNHLVSIAEQQLFSAREDGTKTTNSELCLNIRIYAGILLSLLINRVVFDKNAMSN